MHRGLEAKLAAERRLAVVLQPLRAERAPALTVQALMPEGSVAADAARLLRRQLCLAADRALQLFSAEDRLLRPGASLRELSRFSPSDDGFLYLYYADAPAFGA